MISLMILDETTDGPIVLHSLRPTTAATTAPTTPQSLTLVSTNIQTTIQTTINIKKTTSFPVSTGSDPNTKATEFTTPPITEENMNKTKVVALKAENQGSSGTIIVIVIPLFCCVLIAVVVLDIYYRWR